MLTIAVGFFFFAMCFAARIKLVRLTTRGNLTRTTLRNIIGTLTLKSANSEHGKINSDLQRTMRDRTNH